MKHTPSIIKKVLPLFLFVLLNQTVFAQENKFSLYNPSANADSIIDRAVLEAKKSGRHVLIEVGGNWCRWCKIFHDWSEKTFAVDSVLKSDYVVAYINYSKENKNPATMKRLMFPQRFGFPVFVVLDDEGRYLHTQNTGYLEEGEGYDEKTVVEFLSQWNKRALSESSYPNK